MSAPLSATLGERGLSLEAAATPATEVDALPPVLPPEGVRAARLADVAATVLAKGQGGRTDVAGVKGSASSALVAELAVKRQRVVLVTHDLESARRAADEVGFFLRARTDDAEDTGEGDVLVLVGSENSPYADVNPDRRAAMGRMATLAHLALGEPWRVLVVSAAALVRKVVPRAVVEKHTAHIVAEDELDRDALVARLAEAGYLRVPVVEDPGSFAVRGALLDVWPPNLAAPVRVELYGDLVLSIKPFDPYDQRTKKEGDAEVTVARVWLAPAREAILSRDCVHRAEQRIRQLADAMDMPTLRLRTLLDDVTEGRSFFGADGYLPAFYKELEPLAAYVPEDAIWALDDPPLVTRAVREERARAEQGAAAKAQTVTFLPEAHYQAEEELVATLERRRKVLMHRSAVAGAADEGLARYEVAPHDGLDLASRDHEDLGRAVKAQRAQKARTGSLEPLVRRIRHWNEHGLSVLLAARAETQAERLSSLLAHQGIGCSLASGFDAAWLEGAPTGARKIAIVVGPLSRGCVLPADGLVLVAEEEVFGARAHRAKRRTSASSARAFLEDLRSLEVGDWVVHVDHGVGRYQGLVHKTVGSLTVDLLVVEYAGGDKLYLPVYRLNQIQKYTGREGAAPKPDRLGGSTFAKTKARAKKEVRQMADELLRLYAERKGKERPPLPPADDDYRTFEATFPFDETPDQARAIDDVSADLEGPHPMDRLVCGDVGFGKTEVAIRAAYRAAHGGRQVAILCPTTVLAQQHFRTFDARLRDHGVVVRALSRFQSKKEESETLLGLKEGKVDVVIGTHRLLSKDVHFKNLGLLVVDEEQRFGVAHKERIKQLKTEVDVLTLSATPIPRTLQLAVGGIRDLSLITTPPADRRAVRTIVTRWDEQVLREAVQRELARGGQVFYVYNRIEGLYERATRLQQLVPEARIAVAHGQMGSSDKRGGEGDKEGALERTMLDFVEGRYDVLCATAIVESGLDIPRANTMIVDRADLFGLAQLYQLRGRVGRSRERAYCYLVVPPPNAMTDEARARIEALERHTELGSGFQIASLDMELRGAGDVLGGEQSGTMAQVGFDLFCQMLQEAVAELRGEEVVHDVDPDLTFDVPALLPEDYVADVGVRLALYKRLAGAADEAAVLDVAAEMENRFGPPPDDAKRLVRMMTLKTELRRLRVLGCEGNARSVTLHLKDDTPLDPRKVTELVRAPKSPWRLTPDMRLVRRFDVAGETSPPTDGLEATDRVLATLAKLVKDA
jgi:transcription-repair coupling factor (superfamily II helicase)